MTLAITRRTAAAGILALGACARPPAAQAEDGVDLAAAAARSGIVYGTATEAATLDRDPAFAALVARQCALLTAENALKWNALRPTLQDFDFARADRLADIAVASGQRLHGHCLVWHEALPAWFAAYAAPDNAEALLRRHIETVVGRYAGRIGSWDVVNEGIERNDRRPDGLRNSPWMKLLGPRYFEIAYGAAHAADPSARLTLADYGLEYDDERWMVEKRVTTLAVLRWMLGRGMPVHALALQGHLYANRAPAFGPGLKAFLAEVAAMGLDIYVTELDVDDQKAPGSVAQRDQATADIYKRFLDAVLSSPRTKSVVTWGLSDRYTSKSDMFPRADGAPVRPLPFDAALQPKAAARAMQAAFERR